MHLVTNTLPTTQGRALHPCHTYPTLTYQLAATRLREMGVDVPGDGWITDVFLEDVVKHIDSLPDADDHACLAGTVEEFEAKLDRAEREAKRIWSDLGELLADVADGEDYGEDFDLNARLTTIRDAVTKLRDGMDR